MPTLHPEPTTIEACGNKPKIIKEYIGCVNSNDTALSIAQMSSPSGWEEPGQRPEFDEYSIVLTGSLQLESEDGSSITVDAGQAVTVQKGEWIKYSTPGENGATYIAVCLPAFSPDNVHRDGDD